MKHLRRLRDNRYRRKSGEFLTDGIRVTRRAIGAGLECLGLYVSESTYAAAGSDAVTGDPRRDLDAKPASASKTQSEDGHWPLGSPHAADVTVCSEAAMKKFRYGQSDPACIGHFRWRDRSLDSIDTDPERLVVILDRMEKPGNVGAIFRSADAAGVAAMLLCDGGDPLHPNALRNSMGATLTMPWARSDERCIRDWCKSTGRDLYAARVEASHPLDRSGFNSKSAIVLGSEAFGLGQRWSDAAVQGVHIPMRGMVDSLNVSVAAAVLMFHAAMRAPDGGGTATRRSPG